MFAVLRHSFVYACLLLMIAGSGIIAEDIQIRFFNSATGAAIEADGLFIQGDDIQLRVSHATMKQMAAGNAVETHLPPGTYELTAQAAGYHMMSNYFILEKAAALDIRFYLEPVEQPVEMTTDYVITQKRPDATFISGYVVDAESGAPLQDVQINSTSAVSAVSSDESGYFAIYVAADSDEGDLSFSRNGYVRQHRSGVEIWSNGDWQYQIRLRKGAGREDISDSKEIRRREAAEVGCEDCETHPHQTASEKRTQDPTLIRGSIRVGRSCTGTSCTTVEVYDIQTYVKRVVPSEWFSCWGDLSSGLESLRAGAVAVRTYASWHVYNPIATTYDICENTFCQFFGNAQSSNGNVATDDTERFVMIDGASNIPRSEYSAENNDAGCGDGFAGTGTSTAPCISDPVCVGQTTFGHGRGLCQYGTIRWAAGSVITRSAPCSAGSAHSNGTKTWQEMLDHYYPNYTLVQAAAATSLNVLAMPLRSSPGETVTMEYWIDAAPSISLMLGASVAPTGTINWVSDEANDVKVDLVSGINIVNRSFDLPIDLAVGTYDILAGLWYDNDNNDVINTGDFQMDSEVFASALVLEPVAIEPVDQALPAEFQLAQNYPNPFNPTTTIQFSIRNASQVRLTVFNAIGEEVSSLVDESLAAGTYNVQWDALGLSSGIYVYRLEAVDLQSGKAGFVDTKKMILSR